MVEVDGKPACCVIPSDRQLSMERVAGHFHARQGVMMRPVHAAKLTGSRVGGINPFGQKRDVADATEAAACATPKDWIKAGQRGLLLGPVPQQALAALGASAANLIA